MKTKQILSTLMSSVVVLSALSPLVVNADIITTEMPQQATLVNYKTLGENDTLDLEVESEVIYQNPQTGEIYTSDEVIVSGVPQNPRLRSVSASPISVGILWKYNIKASGTLMRDTFRKCATAEGAVGVIGAIAAVGLETGPVDAVLAVILAAGTLAFHSRFSEAADMINQHPNSGKIYMYLDHCTYASY
ncbi:hypothetical protein [Lactococcus lactis]|uniref:hypothetical protein n=1 Tax=Lactococcus lactis TaxID=1358 RepID=UPI0022DEFB07|nr:hypothetical protein [Lactococcus lactis]